MPMVSGWRIRVQCAHSVSGATYWYAAGISIPLGLNLHTPKVQDGSNYLKDAYLMGLPHS